MKRFFAYMLLLFGLSFYLQAQEAKIDHPAPDFALKNSEGKTVKLSDYKGKYIVLEWINYGCPFVKKHYNSGNMQALQEKYRNKGVVWLAICSSAPGKQGYFAGADLKNKIASMKGKQSAYLIDSDGIVGTQYGAKTTPHMYIIDPAGKLIYAGGIDDIRSTDVDDIKKANNYVQQVLDAVLAGQAVPVKTSTPYGCSIKYKN